MPYYAETGHSRPLIVGLYVYLWDRRNKTLIDDETLASTIKVCLGSKHHSIIWNLLFTYLMAIPNFIMQSKEE
jgi:hypothetical protein